MNQTFSLVPPSAAGRRLILALGVCLFVPACFLFRARNPFAAIADLAGAGLIFFIAWSMQHVEVILSSDSLRIRGDLFGRSILRSSLRVAEAQVMSLSTDRDHQPTLRTCGTAAPGYLAGWFRLRNGEKSLAFVTDQSHVVYLPTTQGYSILLSIARPGDFMQALRSSDAGF
jgi:hypothetical protein